MMHVLIIVNNNTLTYTNPYKHTHINSIQLINYRYLCIINFLVISMYYIIQAYIFCINIAIIIYDSENIIRKSICLI